MLCLQVVSFLNPALQDLLVILPRWLYLDLVGRLLSEPPLPPPYIRYDENGCAEREVVVKMFADVHPEIEGEFVLKMLAERGLVVTRDSDKKVMALFKLTAKRPIEVWPVPEQEGVTMFYMGRRKIYSKAAGISLALFPLLQWHLYNLFLKEEGAEMPMWKDGIRVVSSLYKAEAIVERRPEIQAVDVIARGHIATDCQHLMHKLLVETMAMADEMSPGSRLQHFYLSLNELRKHSSSGSPDAPKVQYAQARVEQACSKCTFVTDDKGAYPEDLTDLFLLPEEGGGKFSFELVVC